MGSRREVVCCLCGSEVSERGEFATGVAAVICRGCAVRSHQLFSDGQVHPRLLDTRMFSDDSLLLELTPGVARASEQAQDFLHDWVRVLRSRRVPWTEIGGALGISRQAAWERFHASSSSPSTRQGAESDEE